MTVNRRLGECERCPACSLHDAARLGSGLSAGELNDVKRRGRLDSGGRGTLTEYARRGYSALYRQNGSKLTPFQAFQEAGSLRPRAFTHWQGLLARAKIDSRAAEIHHVPASRLSPLGKRFTQELLRYNYDRIIQAQPHH